MIFFHFVINEFFFICVFGFFISEKQIQILFQEPCAYIAIIWFVKALIYWLSCIPFSFLFLFFNNLFFYVPMHSMCPTWGWGHYNQLPICLMCPKGQCWSQVMTDNLQYEVDSEGRQNVVRLIRLLLCFCVVVFWQWTDVFLSANSRANWIHAFAITLKCLNCLVLSGIPWTAGYCTVYK